jgi:molybdenum cofactor cytidylyltransferase
MPEQTTNNIMLPTVGIVILAAGGSTRMGQPKQLLPYQGQSLVRRVASAAIAASLEPVVVVIGARGDRLRAELANLPIHLADNPNWATGISSSLRMGIETLQQLDQSRGLSLQGAIVALADQPFVSAALFQHLCQHYQQTRAPIVAAQYATLLGVPALFDCSLFPALTGLQGDQGARWLIRAGGAAVCSVPFERGAIDIDTPEDYRRLCGMGEG